MARRFGTEKVSIANGAVTTGGGTLDVIIPAQDGIVIGINQLIASNQANSLNTIRFYNGNTPITPNMALGASGTLILDVFGGSQLELSTGSGLFGSSDLAGNIQTTIYYVAHDEGAGVTKVASRAASLSPITVRTPNRFGGQTEN